MIDFIFQVDLSTIYIILRRDFSSPIDKTGTLTSPVGQGFYYTAGSANEAARQYCQREACKALEVLGGQGAVHGERDGLYRGGCVVGEPGRERFEVRVKRLKAKGAGVGGRMVGIEGQRSGSRLGTLAEHEGEVQSPSPIPGLGPGTGRTSTSRSSSSMGTGKEKRGSRIGRIWETVRRR